MAQYQPPDKNLDRKRNKTGYNMFFSAHVLRMKQTENGVPSERGSVARIVGTAWKQLGAEDKQFYEREADKHNGMNPLKGDGDDDEENEDDDERKQQMDHYQYPHPPPPEMLMHHATVPAHMQHAHDPRSYYLPTPMYTQPAYGHYDYSQHHQRHQQARGYNQGYAPPQRQQYEG
jgi:hypothetical protein